MRVILPNGRPKKDRIIYSTGRCSGNAQQKGDGRGADTCICGWLSFLIVCVCNTRSCYILHQLYLPDAKEIKICVS